MKTLIGALAVAGAIAILPDPPKAVAATTAAEDCVQEQIDSCDRDFDANSWRMAAIRGWCYIIRIAWCETIDN